eukprot:s2429_g4.t1
MEIGGEKSSGHERARMRACVRMAREWMEMGREPKGSLGMSEFVCVDVCGRKGVDGNGWRNGSVGCADRCAWRGRKGMGEIDGGKGLVGVSGLGCTGWVDIFKSCVESTEQCKPRRRDLNPGLPHDCAVEKAAVKEEKPEEEKEKTTPEKKDDEESYYSGEEDSEEEDRRGVTGRNSRGADSPSARRESDQRNPAGQTIDLEEVRLTGERTGETTGIEIAAVAVIEREDKTEEESLRRGGESGRERDTVVAVVIRSPGGQETTLTNGSITGSLTISGIGRLPPFDRNNAAESCGRDTRRSASRGERRGRNHYGRSKMECHFGTNRKYFRGLLSRQFIGLWQRRVAGSIGGCWQLGTFKCEFLTADGKKILKDAVAAAKRAAKTHASKGAGAAPWGARAKANSRAPKRKPALRSPGAITISDDDKRGREEREEPEPDRSRLRDILKRTRERIAGQAEGLRRVRFAEDLKPGQGEGPSRSAPGGSGLTAGTALTPGKSTALALAPSEGTSGGAEKSWKRRLADRTDNASRMLARAVQTSEQEAQAMKEKKKKKKTKDGVKRLVELITGDKKKKKKRKRKREERRRGEEDGADGGVYSPRNIKPDPDGSGSSGSSDYESTPEEGQRLRLRAELRSTLEKEGGNLLEAFWELSGSLLGTLLGAVGELSGSLLVAFWKPSGSLGAFWAFRKPSGGSLLKTLGAHLEESGI